MPKYFELSDAVDQINEVGGGALEFVDHHVAAGVEANSDAVFSECHFCSPLFCVASAASRFRLERETWCPRGHDRHQLLELVDGTECLVRLTDRLVMHTQHDVVAAAIEAQHRGREEVAADA